MIISQVLSYGHCVFSDWKCIVGIFIKKAPIYFERIWSYPAYGRRIASSYR